MGRVSRVCDLSRGAWRAYWTRDELSLEEFRARSRDLPSIGCELPVQFPQLLQAAGLEPDPYFSKNYRRFVEYEHHHLWFRLEFEFPDWASGSTTGRVLLEFAEIDTLAEVYLDGRLLGESDDFHLTWVFDVTDSARRGPHELVVHVLPLPPEERPGFEVTGLAQKGWTVRKPQHAFGWDIFPRLLGGGIHGPVLLHEVGPVWFMRLWVETLEVVGTGADLEAARLALGIRVEGDPGARTGDLLEVAVEIGEASGAGTRTSLAFRRTWEELAAGLSVEFDLASPKAWMPRPWTSRATYVARVVVNSGTGVLCESSTEFGVRVVELVEEPRDGGGRGFRFSVNGERMFVAGTNWVPLDALHLPPPGRLDAALGYLEELHCNVVRVWGDGTYGSDEFYEWCDEHGVLVWQDFAMACGTYEATPEFVAALENEVRQVVNRIRCHPSLALLCGDNENERDAVGGGRNLPPLEEFNVTGRRVIPAVLKEEGVRVPYIPSSPYNPDDWRAPSDPASGNAHLWFHGEAFRHGNYFGVVPSFVSEVGHLSLPAGESLASFLPRTVLEDWESEEWAVHFGDIEEHRAYRARQEKMRHSIELYFGAVPRDLEDYVMASQCVQAEALKYWIEMARARQGECGGIIWWNLLDGWPQCSDAVVDYYLRRKVAYWVVEVSQREVSPIAVAPGVERGGAWSHDRVEFWLANNSAGTTPAGRVTIRKTTPSGNQLEELAVGPVEPQGARFLGEVERDPTRDPTSLYLLEFVPESRQGAAPARESGRVSGKNFCIVPGVDFDFQGYQRLLKPALEFTRGNF
ncbi:MAG: glycosyl hydrolase 2 galactose-binding domain-containing protein [Promethearchaeota archaeon]